MTQLRDPAMKLLDSQRRTPWRGAVRRVGFIAPAAVIVILALIALFPSFFASFFGNGDPRFCDLGSSAEGPTRGHPFGFDLQGCDVYANVIFGTQSSLGVGLLTAVMSTTVAVVVGIIAGYRGGVVDWVLSRLTDVFLGFPFLLGAIVVLTTIGSRTIVSVSLVLALFSWPLQARLMRTSTRTVRGADFVRAAITMGVPTYRILVRYILPNAITPVLVIAAISVGSVIIAESSLTYLGIGLEPPTISWGLQLANGSAHFIRSPHMLVFPALFLATTIISIIVLGDTLRSALDPRRQR
ncbi:ABC transporter permease [Arthrobacter sp. GMC3]|uniref:ABC transporter permease n=1 Tax=Arthrobacter sp. GMC3 TaxID=2058894 RepID=UPI000CE32BAE|nr:ABC transporter permease [Arthrobacter sp. GMC3]